MHLVRGVNQYRQLGVTLTEERGGRFSLRVRVKPVGAEWHRRHTVAVRQFRMSDPPDTLSGVVELLVGVLADLGGPSLDG